MFHLSFVHACSAYSSACRLTSDDSVKTKVSENPDDVFAYSLIWISNENYFPSSQILLTVEVVGENAVGRQIQGVASEIPGGKGYRECGYRVGKSSSDTEGLDGCDRSTIRKV